MRQRLVHLIHANETRLRLERAEANGTATPADLERLKTIRSALITDLIKEVTEMGRDLANVQHRARRHFPYGA